MGIKDDINRILRDHEGYTGDGRGGVGDLPIGDRSTARKPISKRDLREVLGAVHDSVADPAAAAIQAAEDAEDAADRAELAAAGVEHPVSYAPQTLTAPQQAQARDNIGAADSATAVVNNREIAGGTGLTGGGDLSANRTIEVDFADQAEALAGTATDKVMSPARVMDAVQSKVVGEGQQYAGVTNSRTPGTWYSNTTGRTLLAVISGKSSTSGLREVEMRLGVNVEVVGAFGASTGGSSAMTLLVPPGYDYRVSGALSSGWLWVELR